MPTIGYRLPPFFPAICYSKCIIFPPEATKALEINQKHVLHTFIYLLFLPRFIFDAPVLKIPISLSKLQGQLHLQQRDMLLLTILRIHMQSFSNKWSRCFIFYLQEQLESLHQFSYIKLFFWVKWSCLERNIQNKQTPKHNLELLVLWKETAFRTKN